MWKGDKLQLSLEEVWLQHLARRAKEFTGLEPVHILQANMDNPPGYKWAGGWKCRGSWETTAGARPGAHSDDTGRDVRPPLAWAGVLRSPRECTFRTLGTVLVARQSNTYISTHPVSWSTVQHEKGKSKNATHIEPGRGALSSCNVHSVPFIDKTQACTLDKRCSNVPIHYHSFTVPVLFKQVVKDECAARKQ